MKFPESFFNSNWRIFWGLTILSGLVLLPGTWSPSQLTRGDVTKFILPIVLDMHVTGDWLTPHLYGHVDFTKPPLFHWLGALCFKIFSVSFFSARLPALLCTWWMILMTYAFGRLLDISRERSALGAILLLGSSAILIYCRQPLLEAPLSVGLMLGVYGLAAACLRNQPLWLYLAAAGFAASAMVKWIVGPLSFGLFMIIWLSWSGQWRKLRDMKGHFAAAASLAIAATAAWPVWMMRLHGDDLYWTVYKEIFAERFKVPTGVAIYLAHSLFLGLPWILLIFAGLFQIRRLPREQGKFFGSWLAAVFLPVLVISSRTSRYTVPAMPVIFLAVAALWQAGDRWWRRALQATAWCCVLAVPFAVAVCWRLKLLSLPFCGLELLTAAAGAYFLYKEKLYHASVFVSLAYMVYVGPAYAGLRLYEIPKEVIGAIGQRPAGRFKDTPYTATLAYIPLYLKDQPPRFYFDRRANGQEGNFDEAMQQDALILLSEMEMPLLEEFLAGRNLSYTIFRTWQAPSYKSLMSLKWKAFVSGDLSRLHREFYLVGDFKSKR
ncbi:MAG: hypothetical protein A3G41_00965 [Elusimicrobia bacterium RIFCSPLOWO2_12_FULL_59_9]|nr:MAG: hypothetical protein A3G41_00965 [Elusimicrobia bacterium RIFCSPLOWO2_12_FULL_59_9]